MKYRTLLIMGLLALLLPLAHAAAQTTPPPPETGAFDQLSPGGQKIANAIFEAQVQPTPPPTGPGTTTGTTGTTNVTNGTPPQPLTLDQIAQKKLDGQGWGVIFKNLKAQGLVTTRNLGQAVSSYNHRHHLQSGTGVVTTAGGRPASDGQAGGQGASENKGGSGGHGWKSGNGAGDSGASYGNSGHGSSGSQGGGNSGGSQGNGNAYGKVK